MSDFAGISQSLGDGPLAAVRAMGRERLQLTGLPDRKNEDWKYTSTRPILAATYAPSAHPEIPHGPWDGEGVCRMVFVDGRLDTARSDSRAISLFMAEDRLGDVLGEPSGFDAVNAALLQSPLVLNICGPVDEVLHVVHINGTGASALRTVIHAESNSKIRVVEHILGAGLTSSVTEIRLGDNAEVHHLKVQDIGTEGFHVGTLVADVGADARLIAHSIALGGRVARTDFRPVLARGASCELSGLTLASGDQVVDNHVTVDHAEPDSNSSQTFRAILGGKSRGVFTGKVIVRQDAQRIDSTQQNNNLLLSDDAIANSRPQLEIYADDVKCAHGATVGRLDPEAEFYLRSRGLSALQARGMLTYAFANEILGSLPDDDLRSWLQDRVRAWLEAAQ